MRYLLKIALLTLALALVIGGSFQVVRAEIPPEPGEQRANTGQVVSCAQTQQGPVLLYDRQAYPLDSGMHAGVGDETAVAYEHTVRIAGAQWLRLHFGDYYLGQRSFITITSLQDGSRQRLDATSIREWGDSSGFFNGDAVVVRLHVAPGDAGVFFRLEEVSAGGPAAAGPLSPQATTELCGTDDRHQTDDPAVGRFIFDDGVSRISRCTGYIASNAAVLTAGHCAEFGAYHAPVAVEFNVPDSDGAGNTSFALLDDQYPLVRVDFRDNGVGDDWGVLSAHRNSNTRLLPVHAQGKFYRLALAGDVSPPDVRVTGHGVDTTPNEWNRTLQTDIGDYLGETGDASRASIEYIVDTMSGNSGSPVISPTTGISVSIGIHTAGGCNPPGDGNNGTSFLRSALADVIEDFPGENTVYVDRRHPIAAENGTPFRPYDLVSEGRDNVPVNGIVSIVAGTYTRTLTIDKAMTLIAPVGHVIIGKEE
jgi:V8-like Glu-specific endopeptidase